MTKAVKWSILLFILYGVFMTWYLYFGANTDIPEMYKGSAADPSVFKNERQMELSEEYSKIRNILFFVITPFEWLMYFLLLAWGITAKFRNWSVATTKFSFLQYMIYVFWFSLITTLVMLPSSIVSYMFSKNYGIAASTFAVWMKDNMIDFWLNYVMMLLLVIVIYILIKKFPKKWWLYTWLLTVPFTLFLMFVKPVIIDPLYNDFYPLQDEVLEEKILTLASKADIPADHVYEVNMSEKTNALNAYVTGIGSNSRIVLWDTTLNKLSDDEILFIMAHEMAHYVKNHVYIGVVSYLLISLVGFYLTAKIYRWIVSRWGRTFKLKGMNDIATLPLILLIFSVLSFAVSPFSNAVSRYQEHTADEYALELTKDPEAAVKSFQQLTIAGLSEVNPPFIVKLFRYGHPTMLERINFIVEYSAELKK